jgi:hypothetical protein
MDSDRIMLVYLCLSVLVNLGSTAVLLYTGYVQKIVERLHAEASKDMKKAESLYADALAALDSCVERKQDPCESCVHSPTSSFGGKPCAACDPEDDARSCKQEVEQ